MSAYCNFSILSAGKHAFIFTSPILTVLFALQAGLAADVDEAVAAVQDVAAVADSVRTKRQETELTAADELSFALAGLGSLIGKAPRSWSDLSRHLHQAADASAVR